MNNTNEAELELSITSKISNTNRPSPINFDVYLPWACNQLQVEISVLIVKVLQGEYVSVVTDRSKSRGKSKAKLAQSRIEVGSSEKEDKSTSVHLRNALIDTENVRINTIYDNCDNLVHIKFDKNKYIPRSVLQILGLIIKFHIYLTSLTINRGLDMYSLHEICKILPKSRITDLCLDGTFLESSDYYLLLKNSACLRQLSLARCMIGDEALKNIAKYLVHPLPASKTLSVLNISTNRFSDIGVKCLAEALRSNRQLVYLNLADNIITDEGVSTLLDALIEFPLTCDELISSRHRKMKYLEEKKELVNKFVMELKYNDDKKSAKKKPVRPASFPTKKAAKGLEKELSLKTMADANKSFVNLNLDTAMFEKAETMATSSLGSFVDPYSTTNITSKDGLVYCFGNNSLSYLNLSYINISYFCLKKLLNVLLYQKLLDRKPRGLVNLCIEGNAIPNSCSELSQIDDILEIGLMSHARRYSGAKKKPVSRGK